MNEARALSFRDRQPRKDVLPSAPRRDGASSTESRFVGIRAAETVKAEAAVTAFNTLDTRSAGIVGKEDRAAFNLLSTEFTALNTAASVVMETSQVSPGEPTVAPTGAKPEATTKQNVLKQIKNLAPGVGVMGFSALADRLGISHDIALQILKLGPGAVLGAWSGGAIEPVSRVLRRVGKDPEEMSKGKQRVVRGANAAVMVAASVVPTIAFGSPGAVAEDLVTGVGSFVAGSKRG